MKLQEELLAILKGKLIYFVKVEMKTVYNVVTGEVRKIHGDLGRINEAVSTTNEF